MNSISDFVGHSDPIVNDMAMLLEEAKTAFESKAITKQQYQEIVEDITEIETINDLAGDLERKIRIQGIVDQLKSIAGGIL